LIEKRRKSPARDEEGREEGGNCGRKRFKFNDFKRPRGTQKPNRVAAEWQRKRVFRK